MKKVLSLMLILVFLVPMQIAFAEGVVVLSSPDDQTAVAGSLEDMQINAEVDLGDRIYTLYEATINNKISITTSDDTCEVAAVWVRVFNFSNQANGYFKNAEVVVTYESERGPFKFSGKIHQHSSVIKPLYDDYYIFYCMIPNYAVNNPGELKMEIIDGSQTMTYYFRK